MYDVFIKVCSLKDVFQKNKKFFFFQKKTAISLKKIIALACCRILGAIWCLGGCVCRWGWRKWWWGEAFNRGVRVGFVLHGVRGVVGWNIQVVFVMVSGGGVVVE